MKPSAFVVSAQPVTPRVLSRDIRDPGTPLTRGHTIGLFGV